MLFNSLTFIVFFVVVLGLHYTIRSWRTQKSVLLIASYIFYAAWNPPFVILLWISTLVDWYIAKALDEQDAPAKRRVLRALESQITPRPYIWDMILRVTGAPGIHFEDYPQLSGFDCPEWSHLNKKDATEFTRRLIPLFKEMRSKGKM